MSNLQGRRVVIIGGTSGIERSGEAMFGGVSWKWTLAMRVSVVNWRTTPADENRTVAAVAHAIRS